MVVWSEDVAVEIEALQATYADNLVIDEEQQQVSMCIQPQQEQQQNYVQCQLLLTTPPDYPEQPPAIQLQDVKGFVTRQEQLQQLLVAEAVELTGELLLGHLFEAAKAWLTEQDQPEGPCIFCLEDLAAAADSSTSTMRLPCFHAYHESCFAEWWCWQQSAYLQQQKALEEQTGATAAAALVREALPPKDGPHLRLSCPTCRAPFQLQDLLGATQQQLQQQQAHGTKQQQQQQQQQHPAMAKLTAAQLQPFLQLQQRHAQLFARQQQRQGIIDTDVSICIADWEGPSSRTSSSISTSTAAAAAAAAAAGAGGSASGGGGAGRGAHHARDGVLPAGRGGRGSSSSSGRSSRGGSRGGRGCGRHPVRLADGADPSGCQERHPQARQPQQKVRQQHGQQQQGQLGQQQHFRGQQQQQGGRQGERDWVPGERPRGGSLQQRAVEGEKLQQPERAPAGARGSRGRGPRAGRGAGRQACNCE